MKVLLIAALILGTITAIGLALRATATPSLVGPCAQRQASDDTYQSLALDLVSPKLRPLDVGSSRATPEAVNRMLAATEALRASWLAGIPDDCLRAHAESWLSYYERDAREWMARKAQSDASSEEYQKRLAEKSDQVRALAARLGVKP